VVDRKKTERIKHIYKILRKTFGIPKKKKYDPVDEIILTVLSQNTSDRNRDKAWERLKARYKTPQELLDAPEEEIAELIRPAGLYRQKAKAIKRILNKIKGDFGVLEIPYRGEELYRYLTSIKGIGPKTAAVVMAFSYDQPFFPVDTHIFRVSRRMGLTNSRTREKAQFELDLLIPNEMKKDLHLLLIELGRKICRARRPLCSQCPVKDFCNFQDKVLK